MNSNKNNSTKNTDNDNPISINEIIGKYMQFWPWFVISVLISLFFAFNYLRYTNNIYKTITSVKITEETNQNVSIDVSKVFNKSSINLDNEKAIKQEIYTAYISSMDCYCPACYSCCK